MSALLYEVITLANAGTINPLRTGALLNFWEKKTDMPRDERKRQKALMKRRSKQKATAQHRAHQQALTPSSPKALLRKARNYPRL